MRAAETRHETRDARPKGINFVEEVDPRRYREVPRVLVPLPLVVVRAPAGPTEARRDGRVERRGVKRPPREVTLAP